MELTIDQALQKGIEVHKAGRVEEADRLFTAILKAQPKHPDANHNMGVLAVGINKVQEAIPFFKRALESNPNTAQFWLSYIDALIKLEQLKDAKVIFDQAKSYGAKGDGFDRLEQQLNVSNKMPNGVVAVKETIDKFAPDILDTLNLDQAIKLAKNKSKEGSTGEAKQIYQDVLKKFPKNKRAIDGIRALADVLVSTATKFQDPSRDQLQPLINLYSQGQLHQALELADLLEKQFSKSGLLYNLFGIVYGALGQSEASIKAYRKALTFRPDFFEAYNNMGITFRKQDMLEDAIGAYKKALAINPDYAEAHNNMGNALRDQSRLEEAIVAFNKALDIKPDYAEAYSNMGITLQQLTFTKSDPRLQEVITSLLDKTNYVRPQNIANAAISLLRLDPKLKKHLQRPSGNDLGKPIQEVILELSDLPLLLKLMSVCPLADLELESFLTDIRSSLLSSISEMAGNLDLLHFQSALALQCFTNEYIYDQTEHEKKALETLEVLVKFLLTNGEQPSPHFILCLASYRSLVEYDWCDLLNASLGIDEVFTRQVTEPRQEKRLKSNIQSLKEITNKVSTKVRGQYEKNPYPRWVNLGLPLKPALISKIVSTYKLRLFNEKTCEIEAPDILIAGCGTGQHPIETAARFKNCKVLAIDLSLSSLAYAKRKTEEFGIQNIEYMQADILDLGKLNKTFDVVESAGVLHHMNNPLAGWRVLTDCLKPGGLIKIGLYSELGRQNIVKMREEIAETGNDSSDVLMKSFRNRVIRSNEKHHKEILTSNDFYSLSMLRDLLFHVQEHRFTIPQIQDCLDELRLKFSGFEGNAKVQKFKLNNTGADDPYDLDKWRRYEEDNPRVFAGMYQFWCQKIV